MLQVWVVAGGLFQNEVNLLKLNLPTKAEISAFKQKIATKSSSGFDLDSTAKGTSGIAESNPEPTNITVLSR